MESQEIKTLLSTEDIQSGIAQLGERLNKIYKNDKKCKMNSNTPGFNPNFLLILHILFRNFKSPQKSQLYHNNKYLQ